MKKVLFSLALSFNAVLSVNAYTTPSIEPVSKITGQFIETKEFYDFVDGFISMAKKAKSTNQIAVMEKVVKNEATELELKEFLVKMRYDSKEEFIKSLKAIEANKIAVFKSNEVLKNGLNNEEAFKASIIKAINDGKIKSVVASKAKQIDCWLSALAMLAVCYYGYANEDVAGWSGCLILAFVVMDKCNIFEF